MNAKNTRWWTGEVKKDIKIKKMVWQKYPNTKRVRDLEAYKEKRNKAKRAVKYKKE